MNDDKTSDALARLLADPRFIESERLADEAIARGDFGLSATIKTLRLKYTRQA